jgi:hypothetical protein
MAQPRRLHALANGAIRECGGARLIAPLNLARETSIDRFGAPPIEDQKSKKSVNGSKRGNLFPPACRFRREVAATRIVPPRRLTWKTHAKERRFVGSRRANPQAERSLQSRMGAAVMSFVRLLGISTLTCGCVIGRYREIGTEREVTYVEQKGTACGQHRHRRNQPIRSASLTPERAARAQIRTL